MVLDFAIILLFLACIAVGVVSAVVKTWSLRADLLDVQDRLNVLEGVTQREVKIRAANSRKGLVDQDSALLQSLQKPPEQPQKRLNWWETGLPRSVAK